MQKGAIVWILSGTLLCTYAFIGILGFAIPGVETLVLTLNGIPEEYIYLSAFITIFIEGLYVVGNFFPGTTLVVLLAILSQNFSWVTFVVTILSICLGWILAGTLNILFAHRFVKKEEVDIPVRDNALTTWYPSFRAAYEVSQVVEGGDPWTVLRSAIRVRVIASAAAGLGCIVLALLIDINEISNEEGFLSVFVIAAIMFGVGIYKSRKRNTNE